MGFKEGIPVQPYSVHREVLIKCSAVVYSIGMAKADTMGGGHCLFQSSYITQHYHLPSTTVHTHIHQAAHTHLIGTDGVVVLLGKHPREGDTNGEGDDGDNEGILEGGTNVLRRQD